MQENEGLQYKSFLIGIDARFYGRAGPGRYTKNIIQHLEKIDTKNTYKIFLTKEGFDLYNAQNPNFEKVLADYPWYSFKEQFTFLLKVIGQKLDLYYVPHFNIPILYPGKIVTAIPDMTMHTYSTEKGTTLPIWYFRLKKLVYKMVFWWAVFRSYKVIVPTKTVLNDFLQNIKGFSSAKYVLAPEGIDPDYLKVPLDVESVLTKYGIKRPFILHVGSMYEHKNIDGLIEMFKLLRDDYGFAGQLVLVSKRDKFSESIYEKIKADGLSGNIILPAFVDMTITRDIVVSDAEVVALRKAAEVYVFAAFKEGFSLTSLEGMALGLPAVISDIDCHREVYGDSVLYFDPYDVKNMADQVNKMLSDKDLRASYIQKGYEQVKKYDWMKCAQITLTVFNDALKNS